MSTSKFKNVGEALAWYQANVDSDTNDVREMLSELAKCKSDNKYVKIVHSHRDLLLILQYPDKGELLSNVQIDIKHLNLTDDTMFWFMNTLYAFKGSLAEFNVALLKLQGFNIEVL